MGGSLKLKGLSKKTKKKDKSVASVEQHASSKTSSQLKFEKVKLQRQDDLLNKVAGKSHKERVDEFNKYLGSLTEHNDIPKVKNFLIVGWTWITVLLTPKI